MDKYRNFSVEDFLNDEFFIDWVKHPGPESNRFWGNWVMLHPEKEPVVQQARAVIAAFGFTERDIPETFYEHLKTRIENSIAASAESRKGWWRRATALKAAAAFLGAVALGAVAYYYFSKTAYTTISSRYAETKAILLPDGSELMLNAHSVVRYAANWSNAHRELWLTGEGFFKIRHIENKEGHAEKFTVHTGAVNVEVLGTRFNIKNSTSGTDVLLTSGSVKCTPEGDKHAGEIIKPNDLYSYSGKGKITVRQVNPSVYTAWMDHKYIFEKTELREICRNLQRYLGLVFIIEDNQVAGQKLSGTLELDNQETLIKTLAALLKTPVKKINDTIIIYAK